MSEVSYLRPSDPSFQAPFRGHPSLVPPSGLDLRARLQEAARRYVRHREAHDWIGAASLAGLVAECTRMLGDERTAARWEDARRRCVENARTESGP